MGLITWMRAWVVEQALGLLCVRERRLALGALLTQCMHDTGRCTTREKRLKRLYLSLRTSIRCNTARF
jgi:hypothetical protein